MRVMYCWTISREVTRPCSIAVCISRMLDSTTVNGCLFTGRGVWAARRSAIVAKTTECVIAILPLDKMGFGKNGSEDYHVVGVETTSSGGSLRDDDLLAGRLKSLATKTQRHEGAPSHELVCWLCAPLCPRALV